MLYMYITYVVQTYPQSLAPFSQLYEGFFKFFQNWQTLSVLYCPYTHGCRLKQWSTVNLPGIISFSKTGSVSVRSSQFSVTPQVCVGASGSLPFPSWNVFWRHLVLFQCRQQPQWVAVSSWVQCFPLIALLPCTCVCWRPQNLSCYHCSYLPIRTLW